MGCAQVVADVVALPEVDHGRRVLNVDAAGALPLVLVDFPAAGVARDVEVGMPVDGEATVRGAEIGDGLERVVAELRSRRGALTADAGTARRLLR
jgi:hypothetical protein